MISALSFNTTPSPGVLWYCNYAANVVSTGIITDYQNNVYYMGVSGADTYIFKYSNTGTLTWQRKLAGITGYGLALDGPGDLYIVAATTSATVLVKYTQAGVVSWQKTLGTVVNSSGYTIAFNKFNYNIVIGGIQNNAGLLAAFDTSGNIVWQIQIVANTVRDIVVNHNTGDIFVQFVGPYISKYSADGVLIKSIALSITTTVLTSKKLVLGTDNLIRALYVESSAQYDENPYQNSAQFLTQPYYNGFGKIFTINLSLDIVTEAVLYSGSANHDNLNAFSNPILNGQFNDIALDLSNNIYVVGTGSYSNIGSQEPPVDALVLKLNSAASAVLWSRKFGAPDLEYLYTYYGAGDDVAISRIRSVYVDPADNVYLGGETREVYPTSFIAKFTSTGAEIGNYDYNNYYVNGEAYNIAQVNQGTFTVNTTVNTTAYTPTTSTYVSSTSTIGVTRYTIPPTATTYWGNSYSSFGIIYDVGTDSSGNTYSLISVSAGNWDILKTNAASVSQWQYRIAVTSISSLAVSATGDIVAVGYTGSAATQKAFIIKLNTSGVVQWQFSFGPGLASDNFYKVCLDSAGNIYTTGLRNTDCITVKFTSAGAITWQRLLAAAGTQIGYGIGVDASSNVYVLTDSVLAKYSSTGTLTWQKTATDNSGYSIGLSWSKLAVSTTGDCSIIGTSSSTSYVGATVGAVFKFNTSGVLSYITTLFSYNSTSDFILYNITLDTSNNVYLVGRDRNTYEISSTVNYIPILVKLSSAGALLLDRRLYRNYYGLNFASSTTQYNRAFYGAVIFSTTTMYLVGNDPLYGDTDRALLLKVPLTGSTVPATFGRLGYGAGNFYTEDNTASYTVSNSALTGSTPTNTTEVTTATRTLVANPTKYQFNAA